MSRTKTRGAGNANAKLTEEMVKGIRRAYARTRDMPVCSKGRNSMSYLAAQYGVSVKQIWRIIHYENWKHVFIKRPKSESN